jgi:hypothetical protein
LKPAALARWENRWDVINKRVKPANKPLQPTSGATETGGQKEP